LRSHSTVIPGHERASASEPEISRRLQSDAVYDFVYVDQESFEKYNPKSFKGLSDGFREYKL
jgi:hypothetical protein